MALSGQWPNTPEGPLDVLAWSKGTTAGMLGGGAITGSTGQETTLLNQLLARIADPDEKLDEEDRRRKAEANRAGPMRFADIVLPTEVF